MCIFGKTFLPDCGKDSILSLEPVVTASIPAPSTTLLRVLSCNWMDDASVKKKQKQMNKQIRKGNLEKPVFTGLKC